MKTIDEYEIKIWKSQFNKSFKGFLFVRRKIIPIKIWRDVLKRKLKFWNIIGELLKCLKIF